MPPGQVDHQANAHHRKVGQHLGGQDKADAAQPVNRPIQGQGRADIDQALPEQPILEKVHHLQIDHIPADIQPEYGVDGVKGFQLEQEQHRLPVVIGIEAQNQAGGEHGHHKAGPQQEKEQPHKVQGDDAGGRALGQAQGNQLIQADEKGGDGDAHSEHPGLHHPHPGQGALVAQLLKPEPVGIKVDGPPEADGGHHDQGPYGNPAAELIALVFGQARQRRPQRLLGVIGQVIAHSAVSFPLSPTGRLTAAAIVRELAGSCNGRRAILTGQLPVATVLPGRPPLPSFPRKRESRTGNSNRPSHPSTSSGGAGDGMKPKARPAAPTVIPA